MSRSGRWGELGVAPDGAARGALAYHPRVLLGVWLYGFMDGTRSSRGLERACRDRVPSLWLTGWQRPDHHTRWRCYRAHRRAMRKLLTRPVRVAVAAGLVELAVQAVDGTRVTGSAARERTLDAAGLEALLAQTAAAIGDLEAQNTGGDEPPPARLPAELERLAALRERVQHALARVTAADGPTRINLTDPDATLQKGRTGGWVVGSNAQAMVVGTTAPPTDALAEPGGRLSAAADVTPDHDDHGQLLPLLEQAEALTEAPLQQVLADGGYHSAATVAACADREPPVPVLMPDPQAPRPSQPYHQDRFVDDPTTDTFTCPQGQPLTFHGLVPRGEGKPAARGERAAKTVGDAGPVRAACTASTTTGRSIAIGQDDAVLRAQRAVRATEAARAASRGRTTLPEPAFGIRKARQAARRLLLRGLANIRAESALLATAVTRRTLARVGRSSERPLLAPAA